MVHEDNTAQLSAGRSAVRAIDVDGYWNHEYKPSVGNLSPTSNPFPLLLKSLPPLLSS